MKKQLNEIKRMQQLAGLITESENQPKKLSEAKDVDSLVSQKARDMFYNSVRAICDDLRVGGVVDDDTITAYLSEEGGLLGDAIEAYYHNNPDEDIEESKKKLSENQPAIYNDKENIVNFLNANTKEFISKLGNPGSKFENLGDPKVATAGKSDTSGIDVSFDREHMLKLFPKDDPYNKVEEIEIAGKKIYYNDYR